MPKGTGQREGTCLLLLLSQAEPGSLCSPAGAGQEELWSSSHPQGSWEQQQWQAEERENRRAKKGDVPLIVEWKGEESLPNLGTESPQLLLPCHGLKGRCNQATAAPLALSWAGVKKRYAFPTYSPSVPWLRLTHKDRRETWSEIQALLLLGINAHPNDPN